MSYLEIIVLGVVQGLTEFLPVSSSGHLVVVGALLKQSGSGQAPDTDVLTVNIALHVGTLFSVLVYYWHRVWRLVGSDRRVVPLLIVGTLPAVVAALGLKAAGDMEVLESPLVAGLMFPLTGALLLWAHRRPDGQSGYAELNYRQALTIGLFQAAAILPGISRSGSTIAAGIVSGLRRESATTFAFLLAIPAIGGAGVLETAKLLKKSSDAIQSTGATTDPSVLLVGMLVAFSVGLLALSWLSRLVQKGRLVLFAYYLIPLGVAVTLWQVSA